MKLEEIKDRIVNFYNLETEEEKSKVIEDIKAISNSVDKKVFIDEVRESYEQNQFSGIGIIYEALGQNPEKWSEFFFEEIQRAFKNAENSSEPFKVLESLEEIAMTDKSRILQRGKIIDFFSNSNKIIRTI